MKTITGLATCFVLAHSAQAADFVSGLNAWLDARTGIGAVGVSPVFYLFLGGLLASLLPCVYPIYPLTASLLRGRAGAGSGPWPHLLTYYTGLACIYFLFGVVAALSGGAFNNLLRLPETNVALAFVFLVLALSTAGLFHLDFLQSGSGGAAPPGLTGIFLMGMMAGLLSSSCVGPFVVGILVKLANSVGHVSATTTLFAALQMMVFGLGLGVPMLLVGLFGMRLPKAGRWMQYVQYALGLVILYFSYVYLQKGLSSVGFSDAKIRLGFAGGLILLWAGYRLQSEDLDGSKRMGRALAGLSLAVGFICMQNALVPTTQVAATEPNASVRIEKNGNLSWHLDYGEGQQEAATEGKPLFLDFSAHWCANCKAFEKLTQSNSKFNEALSKAVLCKIQDTTADFKRFQADARFPELKVGLPFLAILDGKGNLLFKTSDYTRVDDMILFLE